VGYQLWVSALRDRHGVDIGVPQRQQQQQAGDDAAKDAPRSSTPQRRGREEGGRRRQWAFRWASPPRTALIGGGTTIPSAVRARIRRRNEAWLQRRAPSVDEGEDDEEAGVVVMEVDRKPPAPGGGEGGAGALAEDYGVPKTFMVRVLFCWMLCVVERAASFLLPPSSSSHLSDPSP
jgi:hypothetical protein